MVHIYMCRFFSCYQNGLPLVVILLLLPIWSLWSLNDHTASWLNLLVHQKVNSESKQFSAGVVS